MISLAVYICLTGYGAWALEKFLGKEYALFVQTEQDTRAPTEPFHCFRLFDLVLTDDPTNWPWSAYLNLPLLPISLILSRFQNNSTSLVIPLLLFWPPTSPATGEGSRRLKEYWSQPQNASLLASGSGLSYGFGPNGLLGTKHHWPPPPILFGLVGLPFVRAMYQNCYAWAYARLLGTEMPAPRRAPGGGLRFNEGPFVIRIRANLDGVEGGNGGEEVRGQGEARDGQPQPAAAAEAAEPNPDPNAAAVEAAEQLVEINASSLGRRIGGALIIPVIASSMGQLLFALSRHSNVLRVVLGIRQQQQQQQAANSRMFGLPPWERVVSSWVRGGGDKDGSAGMDKPWAQMNLFQQARLGVRLFMAMLTSTSTGWVDSDPVWCVAFLRYLVEWTGD